MSKQDRNESLDMFTRSYVVCALWSSSDPDNNYRQLDQDYDMNDIAEESFARMAADCKRFQEENATSLTEGTLTEIMARMTCEAQQAGHDFWLTRNHHGAGFWDGDWLEPAATALTNAAHAFGECNLYVGDDGILYVS